MNDVINNNSNSLKPMVSVLMLSYNHAPYIRQALDSVLMQIVNFNYEILIHDDASTDGTDNIIREYEKKYPLIIKPIYESENQYSKGVSIIKFNRERAAGKYLAFCECDDCWTNMNKLQIQVDFLEQHREFIATTHKFRYMDKDSNLLNENMISMTANNKTIFKLHDAAIGKMPGQTATIVSRNAFLTYPKKIKELFYSYPLCGDRKNVLCLLAEGDIYCIDEYMSNYRYNPHGSWSSNIYLNEDMTLFAYRTIVNSSKFMKEAFNIVLDNSEMVLAIYIKLWFSAIISPDNDRLKTIAKEYRQILQYIRLFLNKMTHHPFGVINSIFEIYNIYIIQKKYIEKTQYILKIK